MEKPIDAPRTALSSLSPIFVEIDRIIIRFGGLDGVRISVYPPRDEGTDHLGAVIISVDSQRRHLCLHATAHDDGRSCDIEEEAADENGSWVDGEYAYQHFSSANSFVEYLERRIQGWLTADSESPRSPRDWAKESEVLCELAQYAETRGGALLGVHEHGSRPVYRWQCESGHRFNALARVARQWWCPDCRTIERRAETVYELRKIDEEFEGVLLSWSFSTLSKAYDWCCARGHTIRATARIIKRDGCTECKEDRDYRRRVDERIAIAKLRGGRLLDETVPPDQGPNRWKCKFGHVFYLTLTQARVTWCPECIKTKSSTVGLKILQSIARSKKGSLLSQAFDVQQLTYRWRCANGHNFELSWLRAEDTWCPYCQPEHIEA